MSYSDIINDIVAPDSATRYLEDNTNITQMARRGYGQQFVWDQVRARLGQVDVGSMIDKGMSQVLLNGMENSGIGGKVTAGTMGQVVGMANQAELAANKESFAAMNDAQNTIIGVKQHQDSMDMQRQSLISDIRAREEENKMGWAGILTTGLDLYSAANGAGLIKLAGKLF